MSSVDGLTLAGLVVTLGIAIVGWRHAIDAGHRADAANQHAADANKIASDALALAQTAEERADRFEIQTLESRDVIWEQVEDDDHTVVTFRNVGSDEAHDVYLTVDPIYARWPRRRETRGTVGGGLRIAMNVSSEVQDERDRWEANNRSDDPALIIISVPSLYVRARINWKSASGIPDSQEFAQIVL